MFNFTRPTPVMVTPERALPGHSEPRYAVPDSHAVTGAPLWGPWPDGTEVIYLGLGCFWGAERAYWETPGVISTAVGYQGGFTPHPLYEEVCSGHTGHTEMVQVVFDPSVLPVTEVLKIFWELHDPTQGYRQGNDLGTQYRSAIYCTTEAQLDAANATRDAYEPQLKAHGLGAITTEIKLAQDAGPFYPAEAGHQQYLHKNPNGYCPTHSTGVACPLPA